MGPPWWVPDLIESGLKPRRSPTLFNPNDNGETTDVRHTGGAPTRVDRPEIETIVTNIRAKDDGYVVHAVVQSQVFQQK